MNSQAIVEVIGMVSQLTIVNGRLSVMQGLPRSGRNWKLPIHRRQLPIILFKLNADGVVDDLSFGCLAAILACCYDMFVEAILPFTNPKK